MAFRRRHASLGVVGNHRTIASVYENNLYFCTLLYTVAIMLFCQFLVLGRHRLRIGGVHADRSSPGSVRHGRHPHRRLLPSLVHALHPHEPAGGAQDPPGHTQPPLLRHPLGHLQDDQGVLPGAAQQAQGGAHHQAVARTGLYRAPSRRDDHTLSNRKLLRSRLSYLAHWLTDSAVRYRTASNVPYSNTDTVQYEHSVQRKDNHRVIRYPIPRYVSCYVFSFV